MKNKPLIITCILLISVIKLSGQIKFCADSSIRIQYTTPGNPFSLFTNPDTSGINIFTGTYNDATHPDLGIIAVKTNWGDSIYWAKKYYSDNNIYLGSQNSFKAPGGTMVLTCERRFFNINTFLICRIDTNGNMLWARHFPLMSGNPGYLMSSNYYMKNIFVSNDAIYFSIHFYYWDIVGKLDLNGNLLWSRGFASGSPPFSTSNSIADGLFEKNGIVYFASNIVKYDPVSNIINRGAAITQLSDANGSLIKSTFYSIVPDAFAKGFYAYYLYPYKDGSFSLTGFVCAGPSVIEQDNTRFNVQIDTGLNPKPAYYYKTNKALDQTFQFDMNAQKQSTFLCNIPNYQDKFFLSFDNNQDLIRSRKFTVPTTLLSGSSDINFDDNQNIHFIYNYKLNNQAITEYARLSDLAPANTLQCFGIDTASIFQRYPFTLTQATFTWDYLDSNLVNCLPVNIYTQNAVINKQVICKQVSYCDSVKIKGNPSVCLSAPDVRYSVYHNPECLKSINWQIDTSFATVTTAEADSAVTLHFRKCGSFYLKAAVNNCVVNDSFLVTISRPQTDLQLNKTDSVLCPGKTILLQANPLFKMYQWQDGSTQNNYIVAAPGLYSITAIDSCGNMMKDSISVSLVDTSLSVPTFYSICFNDSALVLLPSDVYNITWQPSGFATLSGNKLLLYPPQTTTYTIRVQRAPGCGLQKSIDIVKDNCPEWVRFPSAFTPNNDGLNDYFKPGVSGRLVSYNLKIYERNGQVIFNSNNPYAGWNGMIKGVPVNGGVYVFMCHYHFTGKPELMQKGTLVLIR